MKFVRFARNFWDFNSNLESLFLGFHDWSSKELEFSSPKRDPSFGTSVGPLDGSFVSLNPYLGFFKIFEHFEFLRWNKVENYEEKIWKNFQLRNSRQRLWTDSLIQELLVCWIQSKISTNIWSLACPPKHTKHGQKMEEEEAEKYEKQDATP